jgi:hypothetical protein
MSETIQDKEKAPLKIKKPKKLTNKKIQEASKVDLSKKPTEEVKVDVKDTVQEEKPVDNNVIVEKLKDSTGENEAIGEVKNTNEEDEVKPVVEEITKEEIREVEKEYKEAVIDEKVLGKKLPENIEKLINFMEETGGNVEDYVRLNTDYSGASAEVLLKEYYKSSKPHLNNDEIDFLIEDNFGYDEEVDEERNIKKKQLAAKEEIAKAKNFLEETKSKYYDEIKLRPGVTQEQQKAMDFFNRYNKEQKIAKSQHLKFLQKTEETFSNEFKGFEFDLGEKSFRYNVANIDDVAKKQSNLNTFVKKFLNKEGEVIDTVGYHKAIYAAENADNIANHFYEQGKADAVKDVIAKSKNINLDPRVSSSGDMFIGGMKVKAVNGIDSSKLKFKSKK